MNKVKVTVCSDKKHTITVKHATSLWQLTKGLMFTQKSNLLMQFPSKEIISLHNCFVFYPLHLVFFSDDLIVQEIGYMKPFHFYTSKSTHKYCLELGNVGKVPKIGDKISFT